MIIVRAMGGLGNQLQQYALYKKMESLGKDVRLDISWFTDAGIQARVREKRDLELDRLEGISYRCASPDEIRSVLGRLWDEKEAFGKKVIRKLFPAAASCFIEKNMYHENIFALDNKYVMGYFACEKYHADILPKLRGEIRFPQCQDAVIRERNNAMLREIEATQSVSVHIRRGDYLQPGNRELYGNICTDAYYEGALAAVQSCVPDAHFFIFSDDSAYVKERYRGGQYTIVDINHGQYSFYDMWLMSRCKHNICANSTFSFWGARLNGHEDKIMIRPTLHRNNQPFNEKKMREFWTGWKLVSPKGEVYQ